MPTLSSTPTSTHQAFISHLRHAKPNPQIDIKPFGESLFFQISTPGDRATHYISMERFTGDLTGYTCLQAGQSSSCPISAIKCKCALDDLFFGGTKPQLTQFTRTLSLVNDGCFELAFDTSNNLPTRVNILTLPNQTRFFQATDRKGGTHYLTFGANKELLSYVHHGETTTSSPIHAIECHSLLIDAISGIRRDAYHLSEAPDLSLIMNPKRLTRQQKPEKPVWNPKGLFA